MGVMLKDLEPGMVLKTRIGERYIYLGYYKGACRSFYYSADEGYLYVFIGSGENSGLNTETADVTEVEEYIRDLARTSIDGSGCYTKQPKAFVQIVGKVDLSGIRNLLSGIYGLTRVGDRKPLKGRNGGKVN